ncbi:CHAT domain-containing protein [Streptomyces sp. NPDC048669]|uniref:CHAT domain-containing protein n=1 Tax=Streptomyces sp. NPDC048669 TaxID=3155267 RepID=UPI00342F6B8C
MNDIDDAGLRERVADAIRRTAGARALPAASTGPQGADRDALMDELRSLLAECDRGLPDDPLGQAVAARLGALTGSRWAADAAEPDRREAIRLLRGARASRLLAPDAHLDAARDLVVLLLGPAAHTSFGGSGGDIGETGEVGLGGFSQLMLIGRPESLGGAGVIEAVPEIRQLVEEVGEQRGGVPPDVLERLDLMREVSATLTGGDVQGVAAMYQKLLSRDLGPAGDFGPMGSVIRTLAPMVKYYAGLLETDGAAPPTPDGGPPAASAPSDEEHAGPTAPSGLASAAAALSAPDPGGRIDNWRDSLALFTELERPGMLGRGELAQVVARLGDPEQGADPGDQFLAAVGTMGLGFRAGRPEDFQEALRLFRAAVTAAGPDDDLAQIVRGVLPGPLVGAMLVGGSLQDREAARALLEEIPLPGVEPRDWALSGYPGSAELLLVSQCMRIQMRVTEAVEAGDEEALEELVGDLLDLLDTCDRDDEWSFLPCYVLGLVHLALASLTGSVDSLRNAVHYQEQALTAPNAPPMMKPALDMCWAPLLTLSSYLEPSVERIQDGIRRARLALEGVPVMADQRARARGAIALALDAVHGLTGDPAVLDEIIHELNCAKDELASSSRASVAAVHWQLAEAYGRRDGEADDLAKAVGYARHSLRATADEVLLQQGVRHGLQVARTGASRALAAAGWAVRAGLPAEAVACLEEGRALVLGAAAVSATVAERLAERGEHDLADKWRASAPAGAAGHDAGGGRPPLLDAVLGGALGSPELPSALRRRALELLRPAEEDGAARRIPDASELVAAVGRAGVDALVYLLPGQGGADGSAVLLVPGRPPWTLTLPGLSSGGRAPLDAYLDAAAQHATARRGQQRWEAALDALCDWAGEAVLTPVLDELALWERGIAEAALTGTAAPESAPESVPESAPEPVRLTLIACGNLGVVPWQAALLVPPAPVHGRGRPQEGEQAGRAAGVRACELAVLSYAASGREFMRSAGRDRLPADRGQALVCVPGWDLDGAEDEVLALLDTYYPDAALYGTLMTREPSPVPPEGTPGEVLDLLGAGDNGCVALVHLACHGVAGPDPATSALELGWPQDTEPEAGRLTVTALLDTPPGRTGEAGGPLVVLSACETDLSTRDHDEALTLTTALAHRLAADVVGSRWTAPDVASAVLMTVFHDRLAAGLAPPDALRAAQRWMLAPSGRRDAVRGLTPELSRAAAELDLSVPFAWAAFIHQGNPGPSGRTRTTGRQKHARGNGETRR